MTLRQRLSPDIHRIHELTGDLLDSEDAILSLGLPTALMVQGIAAAIGWLLVLLAG